MQKTFNQNNYQSMKPIKLDVQILTNNIDRFWKKLNMSTSKFVKIPNWIYVSGQKYRMTKKVLLLVATYFK